MHATYSTRVSVKPSAATFAALIALVVATALAALVASSRRSIELDPPIAPDGWPISFQPPRGWQPVIDRSSPDAIELHEPRTRGGGRLLVVERRTNREGASIEEHARRVRLDWGYRGMERFLAGRPPVYEMSFGPYPGVQVLDEARGLVIAVGEVEERMVCLGLIVGAPLTEADVKLVDRILESVTPVH